MRCLYPSSHDIPSLSSSHLAIKIARHSPCLTCNSCSGLHPPPDVEVLSDAPTASSPVAQFQDHGNDETEPPPSYLDVCACGHSVIAHGADEAEVGRDEFARRGRAAVRLDELLKDNGKLLDFSYIDDDISNLRKQMRLPVALMSPSVGPLRSPDPSSSPNVPSSPVSSELSELSPKAKRRRSLSSLSEADEDEDDEEDQPLATRITQLTASRIENGATRTVTSGQRSGKSGVKSRAQTGLSVKTSPTATEANGMINGIIKHESRRRSEDGMDSGQLDRLATGVTVDAGGAPSSSSSTKTEKPAAIELQKGIIQITSVENDGEPRSLVILTGLKSLFQKQLPKMPREYIARLVFDSNSKCLAIVKRGYKVVGGICFRPFPHRGFAEIVFFATASVDQVKGYGGMLMDHFKSHIKSTYPGMMHFLTYADNYAVGYFRKQGFSKEITLDRAIWAGYIKDYEGGTIMQCTMLRKVDYLDKASIITQQREAILTKIREKSKSHIVYPGLPQFQDPHAGEVSVDPNDVPGLKDTGWQLSMASTAARPGRGAVRQFMGRLLSDLQSHPLAWAFTQPVSKEDVPDYYEVIKNPMDFSRMEHNLERNQYQTLDAFLVDAQLVFDNCRAYNPEGSIYAKNATKLEKLVNEEVAKFKKREQ